MNKIKNIVLAFVCLMVGSVSVFAGTNTVEDLTTLATNTGTSISTMLGVGLTIFALFFGIRFFKRALKTGAR